ncbi:MAG TPA: tRNA preQ1(34) S-adenosylmethionine ribosyltransferase-isomerase QueA [Candidatus Binatia bacterium]|nr:tRNA preQ1(34) S-adenosylmethionine ribosyltransferase-isomerase QueA [Candidatus Binatia bacterium]
MADLRQTAAYDYELPPELIAQEPARERDASRLMVLRGAAIEHRRFVDFPGLLDRGDVLAINETRVIKARLFGRRESGGAAEVLLLRPAGDVPFTASARRWDALVRPGRRLRPGARIVFDSAGATIVDAASDGRRTIEFDAGVDVAALIERHGNVPLPPYIRRPPADAEERYQTIFARVPGSIAAPTASLHFTPAVIDAIRGRGVEIVPIVLDVGLGTFRPVVTASIDEHLMHAERFEIPQGSADAIARAKREGRRVVAAGTTVVRALEGAAAAGSLEAGSGTTELFITPGFSFQIVDSLLTNFHLPRSTLLALVCAFAGYERIMNAYREAIAGRYRFFSFGDAMFIAERG